MARSMELLGVNSGARARPSSRELPSKKWDVEFVTGRNLFANWCDDVIESNEPRRREDEVWTAMSGTLTLPVQPRMDVCPETATVEIQDLVVASPGGERLELGDVTITNHGWGCFAG